jgi:endo-1,4-beta-D-glucanase Y
MAKKPPSNPLALLKMSDTDREMYSAPEWVDVDAGRNRLGDLNHDQLKAIDDQVHAETGKWLLEIIAAEFDHFSFESFRVRLWLGMLAADSDIKLADFKPNCWNLQYSARGKGDVDPPAKTSASSPDSTETTGRASETSTSASTPGSGESPTA